MIVRSRVRVHHSPAYGRRTLFDIAYHWSLATIWAVSARLRRADCGRMTYGEGRCDSAYRVARALIG
jgi:hypothetical protein